MLGGEKGVGCRGKGKWARKRKGRTAGKQEGTLTLWEKKEGIGCGWEENLRVVNEGW